MSIIAFDQFYLDATLFSSNGSNGVFIDNYLTYNPSVAIPPLANYANGVLVPAGAVITAVTNLQTQINSLQTQINNIPIATQNVNIVPAPLPNQFYLRGMYNTQPINIMTFVYDPSVI